MGQATHNKTAKAADGAISAARPHQNDTQVLGEENAVTLTNENSWRELAPRPGLEPGIRRLTVARTPKLPIAMMCELFIKQWIYGGFQ